MTKIFLIEDHDESLKIWRKMKLKNVDLVHIDAHIDLGVHKAGTIENIVNEVNSISQLTKKLAYSLNFMHYEQNLDKQTDIGNYIYPAIKEGIVKNIYWVIPGNIKEFNQSRHEIRGILSNLCKHDFFYKEKKSCGKKISIKKGIAKTEIFGRKLIVCILDSLPELEEEVLLDIDTDFLIIDTLLQADNTAMIGKRRPWIWPNEFVPAIKRKIKSEPKAITIAYSVNGGYTPMVYKYLGDEIAYYMDPEKFNSHIKKFSLAAKYFDLFSLMGKKEYYKKAIKLNPAYCAPDNNYGPLYMEEGKISMAEKEFMRILQVDKENLGSLMGLGEVAIKKKDFKKAKKYFCIVQRIVRGRSTCSHIRRQTFLGLGEACFNLKDYSKAKKSLLEYKKFDPLDSYTHYLLGLIFEKEKNYEMAACYFQNTVRLGYGELDPLFHIMRIFLHLNKKFEIKKFVSGHYKKFKKEYRRSRGFIKNNPIKKPGGIEKKMKILEELLGI